MTDPIPTQDIVGGTASIFVPYTVAATATSAATSAYSFFRLGNPDTQSENTLPNDATASPAVPGNSSVSYPAGALLYTTGQFEITTPTTYILSPSVTINTLNPQGSPPSLSLGNAGGVNFFSPSFQSAVVSGSQLCSAVLTTNGEVASLFRNRPANVTFQNVDQLQVTAGDSSNFLNGNSLTMWNGNDQSIGLGGLLWANAGVTSNLFGGMIVNVTNESVTVQGLGEYDAKTDYKVSATSSINMLVAPVTATLSLATAQKVTYFLNTIMAIGTAAASVWSGAVLGEIVDGTSKDAASLTSRMTQTNKELEGLTELIFGVQALSVLLGLVLLLTRGDSAAAPAGLQLDVEGSGLLFAGASNMTMSDAGVNLMAPDPGAFLTLQAGGAAVVRGTDSVTLTCGGAAQVVVTPTTVTLGVGAASIVIGPAGLTINGVQVSTNALQATFAPAPVVAVPNPGAVAAVVGANVQNVAVRARAATF